MRLLLTRVCLLLHLLADSIAFKNAHTGVNWVDFKAMQGENYSLNFFIHLRFILKEKT